MRCALLCLALTACLPSQDPPLSSAGFEDRFNREDLGPNWKATGPRYRIERGQIVVQGAKNHPLWLRKRLPRDVVISFDVRSESPEGDIKVEVFGDGSSFATSESYLASSYVVIFGGWSNTVNAIARLDEHGVNRVDGRRRRVEPGTTYRVVIKREGARLEASVDGHRLVRFEDPSPLYGRGHDHFAFNNWNSELWFDNLKIRPLP